MNSVAISAIYRNCDPVTRFAVIIPESWWCHVLTVFSAMASSDEGVSTPKRGQGKKIPLRPHTRRNPYPEEYDYTRVPQYFSDDEGDDSMHVEEDEEGEAGDASGSDGGSEYHVSDDGDSDVHHDDSSDDGLDVGYADDVLLEKEREKDKGKQRGKRMRRVVHGRIMRGRARGDVRGQGRARKGLGGRKRGRGHAVGRVGLGGGGDGNGDSSGDDDIAAQEMEFTAFSGMNTPVPTTVLGFIQLFLTRTLLNYLAEETNMYGMYCRDVLKQKNALNWQGCSLGDIAHYLGLSMLMGIIRLPNLRLYWSTETLYKFPQFSSVMTSARYLELSRFFHAFNKLAVPAGNMDKLVLFRPVMEFLQGLCCRHYTPEQDLSLDEGIMPYKGRLSIKIYSPMKPDKYGVKFYFLCAKSGYMYSFSVYRGVSQTLKEIA